MHTDTASHLPASRLAQLGNWMREHQRAIRAVQWLVVGFYLFLVLVPAFLPLPDNDAHILNNLTLLAQFLFWGIWWPFVLLSMLLIGRTWCGVFCPEGALSEWASRHGRGRAIPQWMKWGGWPFTAFCITTIFGQLVSVYQYPKAALLVLGGSTVAAMGVGYLYGKSKRVWCRHLCPVNGVFALLARLSPLHMQVDRQTWDAQPHRKTIPIQNAETRRTAVNCAPLVDIRRMQGPSECHMCGRCSGHREAVTLALRAPNQEISKLGEQQGTLWDVLLITYGLLGVAIGAFQWTGSPWFVSVKQAIAEWLVDRDLMWPLADNAPWWLLTHYPEHNDVFSWLDGAMVVGYITTTALISGSWVLLWLAAAARVQAGNWRANTIRLAYTLTPLAGCGVFLGLSALTISLLKTEGITFDWINAARFTLLGFASTWSLWLAARQSPPGATRRTCTVLLLLPALFGIAYLWKLIFLGW